MSSTSKTVSAVSRDPFDFLDAPAGDWLQAMESEHSYHESDNFEVSDPLMSAELMDESPEALCALMATSVEEVGPAELEKPEESNPGMSKDINLVDCLNDKELGACCKKLRDMTVVSNCIVKSQNKMYKPYTKRVLTFESIDAEIARQDQEVQEACLKKNLLWVFLAKDITAWAGEYPYVQALVANGNVLLQPRIYRSSEQYIKVIDALATDVLKAKKLLLEQELDLKLSEKHFFKQAGLKRAADMLLGSI